VDTRANPNFPAPKRSTKNFSGMVSMMFKAYKFASSKNNKMSPSKRKRFSSLLASASGKKSDPKIRCPNLLHRFLTRLYKEAPEPRTATKFVTSTDLPDFQFLTPHAMASRLLDERYFFPFTDLKYDTNIVQVQALHYGRHGHNHAHRSGRL
jgi:hypothetical protein